MLESLEAGQANERITALRCLRDEVMHGGEGPMVKNTARVLLEIMKELVRTRDNKRRQLELAHDFRSATSGKPRTIRSFLRRYHLLEMPEEWNQISFDDHVHDSSTKGRKSPSHLIMDAWIKGIRQLTVVYYNHLSDKAAEELLEAAEIMEIEVRIGIEFSTRFYDRYVQLFYIPGGISDVKDFFSFFQDPRIESFMEEGRKVSYYQQQYVLVILRQFNERHRHDLEQHYGLRIEPLDQSAFLSFVGSGQPSILHLAKFIHNHLLPAMRERVAELRADFESADREQRKKIAALVDEMNRLDSEALVDLYLRPAKNPGVPDPHIPGQDLSELPDLLRLSPSEFVERLARLHSGYRIGLNLSNLNAEDVLELLYDCKGAISHLEIFNLKDYSSGKASSQQEINELQRAINEGNIITLKKFIRAIIKRMEESKLASLERISKFNTILQNISSFQDFYKRGPLKSRIGSDSTGHSRHLYGMGLAILDTLPSRTQKEVRCNRDSPRWMIPVHVDAFLRTTCVPRYDLSWWWRFRGIFSRIPGLRRVGQRLQRDWNVQNRSTHIVSQGNIVTLGGRNEGGGNGLELAPQPNPSRTSQPWRYLNSTLKDSLKVLLGFIPAFATFALTTNWWVLAYFGGVIWLAITGFRNILQSVLGAGGIRRSPLLRWDSYVNWDRISDSLFYTGVSVPLLEYLMKTVILDRLFQINTSTAPVLLYTVMTAANGIYIYCHNTWRGLPKEAAIGNLFFRSILSIPLAVLLNSLAGNVLAGFGTVDPAAVLQKWAAIISKTASDCVAGVIEGLADRRKYIGIRTRDYETKLRQLFDTYAQLELVFPDTDVLKMLESPKTFIRKINEKAQDLEKIIIINALDLLYFWMYQPKAQSVFCQLIQKMSNDERQILLRSQSVLLRQREVSQLLVNGIVGKKFSQALAFYLARSEEYLGEIEKVTNKLSCRDNILLWPSRLKKSSEKEHG
jgi:hypothetical protein